MQLAGFLDSRMILHEQRALDLDTIYQELVELICRYHKLPVSCPELMRLVRQRKNSRAQPIPAESASRTCVWKGWTTP